MAADSNAPITTTPWDIVIVGAGPVGCVMAERAASRANLRVLLLESREHIAGNCYDERHETGVLIHRFGPHYFRTHSPAVVEYLSRFTAWMDSRYLVKSWVNGKLFPFPINLTTLELFFNRSLTEKTGRQLIEGLRVPNAAPTNSEDWILSQVGRELYEAFYLGYTQKQWGCHPSELDAEVCGRIPVRFTRENRYVDAPFQKMPRHGFTEMFRKMIAHPNITLRLRTDFINTHPRPRGRVATIYTGPIDRYFNYCYGRLPWRSLDFEFKPYTIPRAQPCVQINYPNQFDFTRSVEIKHVSQQIHPHTVVAYEYPRAHGDPYYPIPSRTSRDLYECYRQLADRETRVSRVYFAGRLAEYRYLNTDEAVAEGLRLAERILGPVAARHQGEAIDHAG
jgi:UDP-galactopyranose mutase